MNGKQKCRILKQIRQQIADENHIPYVTRECTHTGECSGTCPFCESEVRLLDRELKKRAALGKQIRIAAICTGVALTAAGCSVIDTAVEKIKSPTPTPEIEWLTGEVAPPENGETWDQEPLPTVTGDFQNIEFELSGYVPSL